MIAKALRSLNEKDRKLRELDLSDNMIADEGVFYLGE
jgi:hypothetical protein